MSLSSGRKSPLTADPNTSRRLTWWRWQRFLICRLRVATNGIIFRRRDFSRTGWSARSFSSTAVASSSNAGKFS